MIHARFGDNAGYVRQTEHARICGELARAWELTHLASDERELLVEAAACHDDGWRVLEEDPAYADQPEEINFLHVDGEMRREVWRRSVDLARERHPYIGVLVASHAIRVTQLGESKGDSYHDLIDDLCRRGESCIRELMGRGAAGARLYRRMGLDRDLLGLWDAMQLMMSGAVPTSGRLQGDREYVVGWFDGMAMMDPWPFRAPSLPLSFETIDGRQIEYTLRALI
jgi:hypothetical protein